MTSIRLTVCCAIENGLPNWGCREYVVLYCSELVLFSRSSRYRVWSAIGIILSFVCPSVRFSVGQSVCNVVHSGSQGWCTGLKVVPSSS